MEEGQYKKNTGTVLYNRTRPSTGHHFLLDISPRISVKCLATFYYFDTLIRHSVRIKPVPCAQLYNRALEITISITNQLPWLVSYNRSFCHCRYLTYQHLVTVRYNQNAIVQNDWRRGVGEEKGEEEPNFCPAWRGFESPASRLKVQHINHYTVTHSIRQLPPPPSGIFPGQFPRHFPRK